MNRILSFTAIVSLAASLCFTLANPGHATVVEGPIFDPYSNADLYVVPVGSWTQAEAAAQALGGNLITIHNATENQFVIDNVLQDFSGSGGPNLSNLPLWIGLYDPTGIAQDDGPGGPTSQHEANFAWVDGSTSAYRNWNPGEPNDGAPGEYYGTINWQYAQTPLNTPGTWNDTALNGTVPFDGGGNSPGPYYGIAAVPTPEPSSIVLLGLGTIALTAVARRKTRRNAA